MSTPPIIAILGRIPALSLAELEARYGAQHIERIGKTAARLDVSSIDIAGLGGTLKLGTEVARLDDFEWDSIIASLTSPEILESIPNDGKLPIGLSVYGINVQSRHLLAQGLELKKKLRGLGYSVRLVPNKAAALTAAAVSHNQLTTKGVEWLIIADGRGCVIARTSAVQDIDAYARRDYERPARSAAVGMLPPKLTQMMINLAGAKPGSTILDPFCGTGVVLQEAALLGYQTYGTDISAELVEMSKMNMKWLAETHPTPQPLLETGDATRHKWRSPIGAVVTEGYLGPALSIEPTASELAKLTGDATHLTIKFLKNLASQLDPGTPVVMTVPAWRVDGKYKRLQIIDQICEIGYTFKQFEFARPDELLYYRKDQIVARELISVTRTK